jgi:hypothetical protein
LFLFIIQNLKTNNKEPNKPDAANPAMALWLTIEDQWRRVADLGR